MRTIETTLYTYSELTPEAQERARDWYRDGNIDYDWFDAVYEMALDAGKIIGIDLDTRGKNKTPEIRFSGFCSQGDGASFVGHYEYRKGASKAIRAEFTSASGLWEIADRLQSIQRKQFYKIYARISYGYRSNFYSHSHTMAIDVFHYDTGNCPDADTENEIQDCMRDFADWIYDSLEKEYEYLQSDDTVAESIIANEYEFTYQGEIA